MSLSEIETRDQPSQIVDRGCGPEFAGTRITVYDMVDYLLLGWDENRIATWLKVTVAQVKAARDYIQDHKLLVLRQYIEFLEREERGNAPDIQARVEASCGRAKALAERLRQSKGVEASHAGTVSR